MDSRWTLIQGTGGRYISLPFVPVLSTSRGNLNVSGVELSQSKNVIGWMEDEWSNKFYEIFIFNSESPDVSGIRCFYARL